MQALTRNDLGESQKAKIAEKKAKKEADRQLQTQNFSDLSAKEKDDLLGLIAVRMGLVKGP
jgi:hypothetical protein